MTGKKILLGLLGGLPVLLVGGWLVTDFLVDSRLKARIDQEIADMPPEVKVSYGEIDASLFGSATVTDIAVVSEGAQVLKLAALHVEELDLDNDPPLYARLRFADFALDLPAETLPADFPAIGGDMIYAYRFAPETKHFEIEQFDLVLDGLATLKIGLIMENLPPPDADNPQASLFSLFAAKIAAAKIAYQDDSLLDRGLALAAADKGIPPEQARDFVTGELDKALAGAGDGLERDFLTALRRLVTDPAVTRLSIEAEPDKPFPISNLMMLSAHPNPLSALPALKELNIKVEAK